MNYTDSLGTEKPELHAGFERRVRGTPRGRSLAEVSETMMRDRSFMRVYCIPSDGSVFPDAGYFLTIKLSTTAPSVP